MTRAGSITLSGKHEYKVMASSWPQLLFAIISVIALLSKARSQDLVYSLPTQQSTVERGQLSSSNGYVFVGAGGTLYRLSSELQQLKNVSVPDSVLGLTTTADGDYLVACFTNRRCAVYNTTTLSTVPTGFDTENLIASLLVLLVLVCSQLHYQGCQLSSLVLVKIHLIADFDYANMGSLGVL